MKLSRTFVTAASLTVALGLGGVAWAQGTTTSQESAKKQEKMEKQAEKQTEKGAEKAALAKVGEKAPDFSLKDANGKAYKLGDFKGKIVVLQWVNPGCPVCKGVHEKGIAKKMQSDARAIDANVVFLAINSTFNAEPSATAEYLKKFEITAPALDDREGKVGRLYGAKTTPHLFVIDAEGILRYQGAIDDDQQGTKGDARVNYVVQAIEQIVAGETVMPNSTKPYGCSVKYAQGGSREKSGQGGGH